MTPMANSLALWPSPPLAMSSLASGRSGTRRGMHAYSWWGSSPRIFSFARSNSASVRRPSRFHSMSSRVAPRLTEATQRPSWLGSPCSLSSQVEPCWRLPSVLSCWAAHAHCRPMSNPAPMAAVSDGHVAKTRRQLTAPIWVLFHHLRSSPPQMSTERAPLRRPLLSLSL